jgi:hypothetical protein
MALPITVPFTFGNATTTQSLSSLDADFSTVYNAVNGIGNGTVSLANVTITGGSIAANITASGIFSGTSNVSITSANGAVSINTNGTNAMYISTSQYVSIGTTGQFIPNTKLNINGVAGSGFGPIAMINPSFPARGWSTGPDFQGTYVVFNDFGVGVYIAYGGTSWSSISDERLKTNLVPIENASSKVSSLRAVTGRFKTDEVGKSRAFLIAQDIQKVFPEAVDASNSEKLGVQYTDVIPLLVAAIQELETRLAALESK